MQANKMCILTVHDSECPVYYENTSTTDHAREEYELATRVEHTQAQVGATATESRYNVFKLDICKDFEL